MNASVPNIFHTQTCAERLLDVCIYKTNQNEKTREQARYFFPSCTLGRSLPPTLVRDTGCQRWGVAAVGAGDAGSAPPLCPRPRSGGRSRGSRTQRAGLEAGS